MYEEIRKSARAALLELLDVAALTPGQQVVIGCSSSEIMGRAASAWRRSAASTSTAP